MCRMIAGSWHRYLHTSEVRRARRPGPYGRSRGKLRQATSPSPMFPQSGPHLASCLPLAREWFHPTVTLLSTAATRELPHLHSILDLSTSAVTTPLALMVMWNS
jgi:hypothetical protein